MTIRSPRVLALWLSVLWAAGGCGQPGADGSTGQASGREASSSASPAAAAHDPFVDVTDASGIRFIHVAGALGEWALPEIMGGGGALFDMDGDEDLDLLLLAGGTRSADPASPQSGAGHGLFRNDGQGRFEDVSENAGLSHLRSYAMGAATGDVNGDGIIDLYVTQLGEDALLLGDGLGRFTEAPDAWGAALTGWSSSATFTDYDGDGDLDLFVVRYIELRAGLECRDASGRRTYCPPASGPPVHDVLLRNDGGRFVDVSSEIGLDRAPAPGLGVVAEDMTGDGMIDFYVTNDGKGNQLWARQPDGSWRDEAMQRGLALNRNGAAEASMGVVAEDLDRDGSLDLFMTHLEGETHTLYRARGSGTFRDQTSAAGLSMITRPGTGFGVAAFDLELDGDLDLAIAQGRVRIGDAHAGCELSGAWAQLAEPNLLLINDGQGAFSAASKQARSLTFPVMVDRAVLSGDIDGDGDIDLIFSRVDGPPQVLRNEARREGTWVLLDPRTSPSAATALGVELTVVAGERTSRRTSRSSDGYLSSRDPRVHFGLPGAPEFVDVEARWPDGRRERFFSVGTGQIQSLIRGKGQPL